jgi:hypothetical protein
LCRKCWDEQNARRTHWIVQEARVRDLRQKISQDRRTDAASAGLPWAENVYVQRMQRRILGDGTDARSCEKVSLVQQDERKERLDCL